MLLNIQISLNLLVRHHGSIHAERGEQLVGGVVAHFLLSVVHCRNFKYNRKVTSGLYGDSQRGNLYAEYGNIVVVNTHSVVYLFGIPQLKLNYHIYLFAYLYSTHTEKLSCIDNADASQLNEVPDRNAAETMFGVQLWADKGNLSDLAEDEYYWADLVGLTVISEPDNVVLGRVKELFETGAHAIMVVEPTSDSVDSEERLIPWHKQTVVDVDLSQKTLRVDWGVDY